MSQNPPTQRPREFPRAWALACSIVVASFAGAQEPARPPVAPDAPPKADPLLDQLVEAHNKERAKEGLPPLKLEARLTEAALVQAKDMAEHAKMSHDGSDGSTPDRRVARAGYRYLRTAENVAEGYRDVAEVLKGWMDSPGHRKNILGDYTEIGVARASGKDGKPYWCADFGTPMPKFEPADASKDLVKRINEERAAAKLPDLVVDDRLAKAAQEQAATLARNKGGTASFEGIDQKPYSELAMSVANGHPDAPAMAKVLLDKPDLKAQVLGKFTRIGTGYATAEDGVPYWCLILATPLRK